MKTRYNKNGTVSIQQMPKDMYYAIMKILGVQRCHDGQWKMVPIVELSGLS